MSDNAKTLPDPRIVPVRLRAVPLPRIQVEEAAKWLDYCAELMRNQLGRIKDSGIPKFAAAFAKEITNAEKVSAGLKDALHNDPSAATSREDAAQTNKEEQTGGELAAAPLFGAERSDQGFLAGGGGGGLIRRTSPVEPLLVRGGRTIGACGGGEEDLSLGMRDRIWKLLCRAEFNVSYWRLMECRLRKIDVAIRIVLGLGAMAGFIGIASDPSLLKISAIVSLVCAMVSAIIMPAVGWDSLIGRVTGIRHRWVDAARMTHVIWEDFKTDERVTTKSIESLEAMLSDINKESFWFGDSDKFRLLAEKESDLVLIS